MQLDRLSFLMNRLLSEEGSAEERAEMLALMNDPLYENEVKDLLFEAFNSPKNTKSFDPEIADQIVTSILAVENAKEPVVQELYNFPYRWMGIVAFIVLIGFGGYIFNPYRETTPMSTKVVKVHEVVPGGYGATLTLANGKKISLTKASNGQLAREAGISISKTADGRLIYEIEENDADPAAINTLSTSRGETYQVRLPDGSLVNLNAQSSLTYSASLIESGSRFVRLTGEGYFEIAKDKKHPFVVKTKYAEVEVLGTHFNVSSYADDQAEKTTLLEGSIKIKANAETKILKPGQQAKNTKGQIQVSDIDTDATVAWKNNEFAFESESIQTVMKMVERWYNVDVIYVGEQSTKKFSGSVSRFENISRVLKIVESTNAAHFKIEGGKIYVSK